jgi:hypothetical protein
VIGFVIPSSLPNFDDHIRAHLGAEGAAGAGLFLGQTGHGIALIVDPVADLYDFLGAGQFTQPAPFTTVFSKTDFSHKKNPLKSLYWSIGVMA